MKRFVENKTTKSFKKTSIVRNEKRGPSINREAALFTFHFFSLSTIQ